MKRISLSIIFALQLFSCCCYKYSNSNLIEKMNLTHKTDWSLSAIDYKWENFNYYGQVLHDCIIEIDNKSIKKTNSYVARFSNGKDVLIEIIEFKKGELAKKAYEKALAYAEKIRVTPRRDYGQLCQPIREWDFHYVHMNNKKIYLIGCINGGFMFKNGDVSLESDATFLHETREIYLYIKNYLK